jgi:hypothetical protein
MEMSDSAILAICVSASVSAYYVTAAATDMFMRWTRSKNIAAHGWPPKHVDADGDPVDLLEQEGE